MSDTQTWNPSPEYLAILSALEDMDVDGTMWKEDATWDEITQRLLSALNVQTSKV